MLGKLSPMSERVAATGWGKQKASRLGNGKGKGTQASKVGAHLKIEKRQFGWSRISGEQSGMRQSQEPAEATSWRATGPLSHDFWCQAMYNTMILKYIISFSFHLYSSPGLITPILHRKKQGLGKAACQGHPAWKYVVSLELEPISFEHKPAFSWPCLWALVFR